ncbi:hypothetical protein GCM10009612_42890 [Streptomyces beijiangensis]
MSRMSLPIRPSVRRRTGAAGAAVLLGVLGLTMATTPAEAATSAAAQPTVTWVIPQEAAKALDTQASTQASAANASTAATPAAVPASTSSTSTAGKTPQQIAQSMIPDDAQYQCFNNIVTNESGWDVTASNASSGAYGLVQALPGSKMASAGSDWQTNPATQIKWGLDYMDSTYGSPCAAWSFWQANGWY